MLARRNEVRRPLFHRTYSTSTCYSTSPQAQSNSTSQPWTLHRSPNKPFMLLLPSVSSQQQKENLINTGRMNVILWGEMKKIDRFHWRRNGKACVVPIPAQMMSAALTLSLLIFPVWNVSVCVCMTIFSFQIHVNSFPHLWSLDGNWRLCHVFDKLSLQNIPKVLIFKTEVQGRTACKPLHAYHKLMWLAMQSSLECDIHKVSLKLNWDFSKKETSRKKEILTNSFQKRKWHIPRREGAESNLAL